MKTRLTEIMCLPLEWAAATAIALAVCAWFLLDRRLSREWDLEAALEDEGEDGPTVRSLLAEGAGA